MAARRPIFVVAGVGNASGTGFASARVFAKAGYRVALIARNADQLRTAADDIKKEGGEAAPFPVKEYDHTNIRSAFQAIRSHWPNDDIRVSLYNAGHGVFKRFLDTTEEDVKASVDVNIVAAFAFARESILAFQKLEVDEVGKKGALLFTSATAALRGNIMTSAFAAGKFGLRALSMSLNKEFGKENIHVATAVIDGLILTGNTQHQDTEFVKSKGIGSGDGLKLNPESIAQTYLYLANQDRSAWTYELDLRPSQEKW